MAKQTTVEKGRRESSTSAPGVQAKDLQKEGKRIKDKTDEVIDKIDDVLEDNAEQFVKDYIQKGGE